MKILIIEDEPEMSELIKQFLEVENYVVESACNFTTGMDKVVSFDYDCILLDVMLPDGNGLKLLQELKKMDKADSVIIISAKDSVDDKVKGLELGADDYLVKPFHFAELNARIKSVIRRKNPDIRKMLEFQNVILNMEERLTLINGKPVELNRKEFDILAFLMMNRNRIASKSAIAENVWGDYIDRVNDFDFIYSQIKNLRKKLQDHGAMLDITSVYGIGYKLTAT
ncbi:MAG: response regulator transcription factor [Bacteroidales bacterium]